MMFPNRMSLAERIEAWTRFAAAAVEAGIDEGSAAAVADRMLAELDMRIADGRMLPGDLLEILEVEDCTAGVPATRGSGTHGGKGGNENAE